MVCLGLLFIQGTCGDTYRLCEVCRQCYESNRYPCRSEKFPQGCCNATIDEDAEDSGLWGQESSVEEEEDCDEEEVEGGLLQQVTEQNEVDTEEESDGNGMSDEY